jgi:glucose-6-phosphate dehydrogenase assembly protein OpcA
VEAAVTDDGPHFLLGSSRRVHLDRVEEELSALWEQTDEEARARGQAGIVRVRGLNLVVYAQGEETADRVSDAIAKVAQCRPARVVVLLDEGPEAGGSGPVDEGWITAACYLTRAGGRAVCWEQVTIPMQGGTAERWELAVLPHLVPDLPVTLWWPGEADIDGPTFARLLEISDRAIVDSGGFADARDGVKQLATLVERTRSGPVVNDLNWTRLAGWREIIAEAFDAASRRPLLAALDRVRVVYGREQQAGGAPDLARALLLAGWLCAVLGWRPDPTGWTVGAAGISTRLERTGGTPGSGDIELVLAHDRSLAHDCDGITQVSLHAPGASAGAGQTITFGWPGDSCVCTAKLDDGAVESLLHTRQMPLAPDDELLCIEVEYLRRDAVYAAAVAAAAALACLSGCAALLGEPSDAPPA